MASRVFVDRAGMEWTVWDVLPGQTNPRSPQFSTLPGELSDGWLCFESAAAVKRRFYPIPANWAELSESRLDLLCRAAVAVRRREAPVLAEPVPVPVPAG